MSCPKCGSENHDEPQKYNPWCSAGKCKHSKNENHNFKENNSKAYSCYHIVTCDNEGCELKFEYDSSG